MLITLASLAVLLHRLHLVRVVGPRLVLVERGHHAAQLGVGARLQLLRVMHDGLHLLLLQGELDWPVQRLHLTAHLPLPLALRLRLLQQMHAVRLGRSDRVLADAVLIQLEGELVGLSEEVARGEAGVVLHAQELGVRPLHALAEMPDHSLEAIEFPRGRLLLPLLGTPRRRCPRSPFPPRRGLAEQRSSASSELQRGLAVRVVGGPGARGAEVAGLASVDELMELVVLVYGVLAREFLDLALGESLADGLGLGELDPHEAELPHLLPAPHPNIITPHTLSRPPTPCLTPPRPPLFLLVAVHKTKTFQDGQTLGDFRPGRMKLHPELSVMHPYLQKIVENLEKYQFKTFPRYSASFFDDIHRVVYIHVLRRSTYHFSVCCKTLQLLII